MCQAKAGNQMAKTEPRKRQLEFNDLDEVMAEARSLHQVGYLSNGNWSLGQACGHLAEWIRYPMDGFPKPPIFIGAIMWVMKNTIGPGMRKKILSEGFKGGLPTAPETVPKPDELSDQQGIAQLQLVINRAKEFDGELKPSPLFGPMDLDTWRKVNLLHAAHHLGYLEPKV